VLLLFLVPKLLKLLVLVAVLGAVVWFTPALGDVSGEALHRSVAAELGGTRAVGARSCTRLRATRWRCRVTAEGGSDARRYSVRMRGRRCWTATRLAADDGESGGSLARRARGCVNLRHQLPWPRL
jgi:hypothetical protein